MCGVLVVVVVIVDAVLDVLQGVVSFFINLLPDFTWPAGLTDGSIGDAFDKMADWARPLSYWFPFSWFAGIVGGLFLFHRMVDLIGFVLRVYALIRGGGAGDGD